MNKKGLLLSILVIIMIGFRAYGSSIWDNSTNNETSINATIDLHNNSKIMNTTPTSVSPTENITTPVATPTGNITNITAVPTSSLNITTPTPTPTPTENITNITVVPTSIVVTDTPNSTITPISEIPNVTTPIATDTPKYVSGNTNISIQPVIIMTGSPTPTPGFFNEFYDKIILAVVLGFIGLSYEIVRINYDHKKRIEEKKTEKKQNDHNKIENNLQGIDGKTKTIDKKY